MFRKYFSLIYISLLLFLVVLSSCDQDDFLENHEIATTTKTTGFTTSLSKIQLQDHKSFKFIKDRAYSIAKSADGRLGTVLDTSHIQVLQGLDYKNYIFKVIPDSTSTTNVLRNYLLVVLKDSIQQQFMVTYPYIDQIIDTHNVLIEPIYGLDILNQINFKCGGGSYESVWIEGSYVDIKCQSNLHTVDAGAGCNYYGGPGSASRIFTEGHFTTQYVKQEPCETIHSGNASNGGGGPIGNAPPPDDDTDDVNTDERDITIGITPNDGLGEITPLDPECKKLEEVLNNSSAFKAEVDSLTRNAGQNFERTIVIDNNNNISTSNGAPFEPSISLTIPNSGNSDFKILSIAHNHSEYKIPSTGPAKDASSVFSADDLLTLTKLISENRLANDFVAFLPSKSGKRLAITIKDFQKFKNFFLFETMPSNPTDPMASINAFNQKKVSDALLKKYYDWITPGSIPKIKTPEISADDNIKAFLELLKESDMGVELLSYDADLQNFKKLSVDENGNIIETNC